MDVFPPHPHAALPRPSRVEAVALLEAARYLRRAGTRTATLLLLANPAAPDAVLLGLMRDELLACAALCESITDASAAAPRAMSAELTADYRARSGVNMP